MEEAIDQGLTSNNFNLQNNIDDGDTRGVDPKTLKEIKKLMKKRNLDLDNARAKHAIQKMMKEAGCDETGMPLDPKFICL